MNPASSSRIEERRRRFTTGSQLQDSLPTRSDVGISRKSVDNELYKKREERMKRFQTGIDEAKTTHTTLSSKMPLTVPVQSQPLITQSTIDEDKEQQFYYQTLMKKQRAERFGLDPKLTIEEMRILRKKRFEGESVSVTFAEEGEEELQHGNTSIESESTSSTDAPVTQAELPQEIQAEQEQTTTEAAPTDSVSEVKVDENPENGLGQAEGEINEQGEGGEEEEKTAQPQPAAKRGGRGRRGRKN
ncbi:uncharacterized protein MONOS_670 [Monocercomonoides exilis]|uniref:uncharacterized protein n=1 Tax=Monocercomonoides exilis TaxID=2049356 RepID=UPI00355A3588|nr:hypothetical protein MONOS_670 [Monocercomonoides exilis]|eukprot:MONOS_670.1-p1 / transcript=MONOS_670.1 / gene=MONOS_670 / organism=Monocercomonoides_exilis_PA203 / gene_product=unspecified product / transcript_product=unspecified product / location=Mono_scaffold00011:106925-107751(+) / protein_length=245 / sequence_SO=supercontig / SO=protein_coding / is_pseudo=false